jgi:Protein of unknown function (DUF4876)
MKKIFSVLLVIGILYSCQENAPLQTEGRAELNILAVWDASIMDSTLSILPLSNAEVIMVSEYGMRTEYTDENGSLHLIGIPSSVYELSIRKKYPLDSNILIVGNISDVEVKSGDIVNDTIIAKPISASGISINEVYCGGPNTNLFYFYDQFIELYNSSNEVKYLDGLQVCRFSLKIDKIEVAGMDLDADGDIDGVIKAFKFPGNPGEKEYAFQPQTFLTLAIDAKDHRVAVENSVDLRHADWEFVNQFNAIDFDNEIVPNLETFQLNKSSDFLLHLTSDIIVIANGVDTVWEDGIDIETIIDGVEFQSSGNTRITLDDRIDRGWIKSPAKYSGESMQRREKGVDTNNGTLDWIILPKPTPGWQ